MRMEDAGNTVLEDEVGPGFVVGSVVAVVGVLAGGDGSGIGGSIFTSRYFLFKCFCLLRKIDFEG